MSELSLIERLKARVQRAEHVEVVGERALNARLAISLGLLMGLSLIASAKVGALAAHPMDPSERFTPVLRELTPEAQVPQGDYRVEVVDLTDARTVTSIHMDPKQWSDLEQRTFLRKLVSQADQRAVSSGRALEVHAFATDGAVQVQAQAFLDQAIRDAGIETQRPDIAQDGNLRQSGRLPGLRFDLTVSNDALGADACFVQTGDQVKCLQAEAEGVSPEAAGVAIAAVQDTADARRRSRRPR